MARTPALAGAAEVVPYALANGDDFVAYHGDDGRPWTNGQGVPHVSDTPYKPSYHDLPLCNGTAKTTGRRCKSKAMPGEEYCEHHKG